MVSPSLSVSPPLVSLASTCVIATDSETLGWLGIDARVGALSVLLT